MLKKYFSFLANYLKKYIMWHWFMVMFFLFLVNVFMKDCSIIVLFFYFVIGWIVIYNCNIKLQQTNNIFYLNIIVIYMLLLVFGFFFFDVYLDYVLMVLKEILLRLEK